MYIQSIKVSNFRKLSNLELEFNEYLNFIIGENDSGKTALIDGLKLVLGTVSNDYIRLENDDFNDISKDIIIELIIVGFNEEQQVKFLDWGGEGEGIKLKFKAERKGDKIFSKVVAGPINSDDDGKYLEPEIKELLNSIYLKPLRDAENDLSAGKNSRLSKILLGHKYFKDKEKHKLVDDFKKLNNEIKKYFGKSPEGEIDIINDIINTHFQEFMGENKNVSINTGNPDLQNILEKLSLDYENNKKPGLGTSNLLFIASELLLLHERSKNGLGIALIEELEAHIHPQKQLTLIDYLQKKSKEENIQMFITSHSSNIASKVDLQDVIICKDSVFYPLKTGRTKLDDKDYKFLQRFLDVTKADLFFAKGLIFVEGIAEAILIPTIAKLFDIKLNQKGISIINLNGLSFERYLKAFIDNNGKNYLGIKIACITDRDGKKEKFGNKMTKKDFEDLVTGAGIVESGFSFLDEDYEGIDTIKYFYNNIKTLEFDLAVGSFFDDLFQARKNVKGIQNEIEITSETDKYKKAFKLYGKIEDLKGNFTQELSYIWEEEMEKGETEKRALKEKFIKDPYVKYILKALEHVIGESILSSKNG